MKTRIVIILSMVAAVFSAMLLLNTEKVSHIAGLSMLGVTFFGMLSAHTATKKLFVNIVKIFFIGNLVIWVAAQFVDPKILDLTAALWICTLCFPTAFLKNIAYPEDIEMKKKTFFSFVGLFQFLLSISIIYIAYGYWQIIF